MADIRLEVGVAVGASYKAMQEELKVVVNSLNKQPRKIKLDLDLAHVSKDVNNLKAQLNELRNSATGIKVSSELSTSLGTINTNLSDISKRIQDLGSSAGMENLKSSFETISGVISNLETQLGELKTALSSFQGVNINLGLSGNSFQRTAAYGQSARETISELQSYARQLEEVYAQFSKIGDGRNAAVSTIMRSLPTSEASSFFESLSKLGDTSASLSTQMNTWREYISVLERVANIKGIDISSVTSQFAGGADAMVESTQKVLTGEQQLESSAEKLKSIFGSGVNAEALTEQLNGIRTAIDGVNDAIAKIGAGTDAFSGFKQSIESIVTKIQELITAVNQINSALGNITPTRQVVDPSAMKEMVAETQSGVQASGDLQAAINRLNELLAKQTAMMEEVNNARAQELADLELERMAEEETASATRQTNTAMQDQINAMVGVNAETKSARESAEVFKAAEQEQAAAQREAAAAAREQAAAEREAASEQKHIDSVINSYNNALVTGTDRLRQWSAAEYSRNSATRDAYHAISASVEAMRSAKAEYDSGTGSIETLEARVREFRSTMKESEVTIKSSGDATKTFGERIGSLAQKFSYWFSITRVIMYVIRTIRNMITNVKEMDEAFTQLQIVTRATDSAIKSFGDSIAASAKKVGSSITDLVNSATTYARLGYSLTESGVLAEYTAMLQNVGDIEVSDAQDAITAIVKAFNIDADNIEEVMDKLVTVGNNFPISVSQIAEGMNNAASSLAAAGNTFEQSVALLTAANTTVQNISKASTGLRTITARLRNTTVDLEELGEEMTEAKYEELVSALTDAQVKLTDVNDEYRSTYDIMSDLAAKWGELSDMTKSALATSIGGTRMQNIFYSIINSFQEASGAMDAMADSEGALAEANETYLDSIEGRAKVLKATFQEFSDALIGSDLIKNSTTFLTTLIEILNSVVSFIDYIGGLPTLLLAVSTALTLVVGGLVAYRAEIIATTIVTKLSTILTGLHTAIMNIVYAIPNAIVAWKSYAAGVVSASTAMQASIPILGILLVAITAVTVAINAHNSALEEEAQKSMQTAEEAATLSDELSELVNKYLELSEAVKTDKSVKEQLLTTQEELIEKLGIEKSRIQELVKEYGNYSDAIKAATSDKLKEKEIELQGGLNAYKKNVIDAAQTHFEFPGMSGYINNFTLNMNPTGDNYQKNYDAYQWLLSNGSIGVHLENHAGLANGGLDKLQNVELSNNYDLSTIEGIREAYKDIEEILINLRKNGFGDTDVYDSYYNIYNKLSEPLKEYDDAISELNDNLAQQYMLNGLIGKETPKTAEEFQDYRDQVVASAIASGEFVGSDEEIAESIDNILSKQPQFAQFYDDGTDGLLDMGDAGDDAAKSLEELEDEIDSLSSALDDLQSAWSTISGIIEDYNENGYYTLDNLQSLLELEPEYLNALMDENGQINLNSQAYRDYIAIKAKTLVVDQIKSLYETILALSTEEAQAYANAEAYEEEADSLEDLVSATTKYYLTLAQVKDTQNNTTAYTDAMKQSFKTVANYMSVYDNWLDSLSSSNNEFSTATSETTSALEAQKDALEDEKDALEDYKDGLEDAKDSLEDLKDELEDSQSSIQSLIDLVEDYIKQMKEDEKDAINDQIDALEAQKDALDEQKDAYADLIDKKKEEIELLYEEKEAQDELSDKQNTVAKDALALSIAELDNSSAGKKAQKQARDSYIESTKALTDYLDEQEKDKRIDALEAEQEAYEEMIESRKDAIDTHIDYLETKIDEIDEYLDNPRKIYEDACDMIYNDTGDLFNNLWNDYIYPHTTMTRTEFEDTWSAAQTAIQKYKGDNETLMGVMESLQGMIYDTDGQIADLNTQIDECETQIGYLDDAISDTSDAINATSSAIDSVSSSLSGLATSISDYIAQLNALSDTDLPDTNNGNSNKTGFWVKYNGERYETGDIYDGDTTTNRNAAAYNLAKQYADKHGVNPANLRYVIEDMQYLLGVHNGQQSNGKWYIDYNGRRWVSNKTSKQDAKSDIVQQMRNRGYTNEQIAVFSRRHLDNIKHYAQGTLSATGGLAELDEHGRELRLINDGDGIVTAKDTKSIVSLGEAIGSNPTQFFADASKKLLESLYSNNLGIKTPSISTINATNTQPINFSYTINGDVNPATLRELKKYHQQTVNDAVNKMMSTALTLRTTSRVR